MNFSNVNGNFPNNYCPMTEFNPIDGNNYSSVENSFNLYQENVNNYEGSSRILKGIHTDSELSKIFFSKDNIKRIQKKIKKEINVRTNGKYILQADQNEDHLLIVMRSIYLQKGRNLQKNFIRQVKVLNTDVVEDVVPGMITNIKTYYGYIDDITKPLNPIPRPVNVNQAGTKTLPSITTTFF